MDGLFLDVAPPSATAPGFDGALAALSAPGHIAIALAILAGIAVIDLALGGARR